MSFRHQFNPFRIPSKKEQNNLPSMTVPDQTISMRKLLENHRRGIPSQVKMLKPLYFETEVPNFIDPLNEMKMRSEETKERLQDMQVHIQDVINEQTKKPGDVETQH